MPEQTLTAPCTLGLSDFRLIEPRKPLGPSLQFVVTWLLESGGAQFAMSVPGFRFAKNKQGGFKVLPPVKLSTTQTVYYSCRISEDLTKFIDRELTAAGWREKVGVNNPVENLLEMERKI